MDESRIFLVRHGQTEWNKEKRFRGSSNVPLNETGRGQAKALGHFFSTLPLKTVYASKLSRALDTAQAIADQHRNLSVTVEEGFNDIHRGDWEGLTHDDAKEKYPDLYKKWFDDPADIRFPNGESLRDLQRRAWTAFDRIRLQNEESSVVLVSHHVVIRVLLSSLLGMDLSGFRRFEVFPASISEVRNEFGKLVIYKLNDVSHLEGK